MSPFDLDFVAPTDVHAPSASSTQTLLHDRCSSIKKYKGSPRQQMRSLVLFLQTISAEMYTTLRDVKCPRPEHRCATEPAQSNIHPSSKYHDLVFHPMSAKSKRRKEFLIKHHPCIHSFVPPRYRNGSCRVSVSPSPPYSLTPPPLFPSWRSHARPTNKTHSMHSTLQHIFKKPRTERI